MLNPWILWQYPHNMLAQVVTGGFRDGSAVARFTCSDRSTLRVWTHCSFALG